MSDEVDERGDPILYYPADGAASYGSRRSRRSAQRSGGALATLRDGAAAAGDALRVATDRALAKLPHEAEAAIRQRAEQARPYLPHAACALVGLLIGRMLGQRAERQRWARGSAPASRPRGGKRASEPELEARFATADRDARRADAELAALHAEMKQLERQLQRSKTRARDAVGDDDAAAAAELRQKIEEAASAYDTLARVLAAERATGALRLARAAAENELLQEQLAQARATASAMLAALEEVQAEEMNSTFRLAAAPIVAKRTTPAEAAAPSAVPPTAAGAAAAAAQEAATAALGQFKSLFGV